ncbi:MAG: hypothetical protein IJW49_10890 [Clostridia bacterium]|nr:hypothetical protein [Clostridia bacterium]
MLANESLCNQIFLIKFSYDGFDKTVNPTIAKALDVFWDFFVISFCDATRGVLHGFHCKAVSDK